MDATLEFEKPIALLERKLQELKEISKTQGVDLSSEVQSLEKKLQALVQDTYAKLTPWQRVQLSRHPNRPYAGDVIETLFPTFMELHGDRAFGDDQALIGGIAEWQGQSIVLLAQQKGRSTKQRMERNFGMPRPEGYRKALRLMEMAERFRLPLVSLIDTPGAYPGMDAEERGQSQAIAECICKGFDLTVPSLAFVLGEGGSGGALAIGIANQVWMFEFSVYSVISPESCASILWSDSSLAESASEKLKMTAQDLNRLGVIDGIMNEPFGGAHRNWEETFKTLGNRLTQSLKELEKLAKKGPEALAKQRRDKFRAMGAMAMGRLGAPDAGARPTP